MSETLKPPASVLEITRDLERAGYEAWCVGGAVRDALLGHPHLDWDLATNATPDQVRTVFGRQRTIPVGVDFGTVGVLDAKAGGVMHEVTTFRRDVRTDGRHADVEFGATLDEDLARRDFTINAIAYSATKGEIRDPFGGRKDLGGRVVRAVGEPNERMREDRLRALRGIRFAARFGFEIDEATFAAIRESAPHLTRLSAERVRQELEKTMDQIARPSKALRLWREAGATRVLLPELQDSSVALDAVDCAAQPGLASRPGRRLVRLAVLFSEVPAPSAFATATRLRFSKNDAQWISGLVEKWHSLGGRMGDELAGGDVQPATLRRWVAEVGRVSLGAFFRVALAHWASRSSSGGKTPAARAVHSLYRRGLRVALTEPVDLRDLAVDGDDLRRLGVVPGPGMGKILSALLDRVLDDPRLNTRERLLEEARRLTARSN